MRTRLISVGILLLAAGPPPAEGAGQPRWSRACVPGGPSSTRPLRARTVPAHAIHVHDGDTFYVGREAIRLRAVDAPELSERGGAAARWRLVQLLRAGPVTIVPRSIDAYCRTIADVQAGGVDVADALRREGLAKAHPWRPRRPP
jgi:endonuclease YncB( thermonuclease family)